MVDNISGFAEGGQARLDVQQESVNVGVAPADDGKAAAFGELLNASNNRGEISGSNAALNSEDSEPNNPVLPDDKTVRSMDDIMNMVSQEERSKLAEMMNETDLNDEKSRDFLKELAEKYGIPLEELMRLLGLAADGEDTGGLPAKNGGSSDPGGSSQGTSGGNGGSSGGEKSGGPGGGSGGAQQADGSSGAQQADGSSSAHPKPEGQVHATSLDGKVKFYAENKEDAMKLKETFDKAYENDGEFKKHVDSVIADKGSMDITAKDLDQGIAGVATIRGNQLAIDTNSTHSTHVLAHEILHNVGHEHGPNMDAATKQASDMK